MTKHNLLTLCGFLIACGLQAGQPSQPSQPTTQQTASDQNGWSGRKKLGIGALGLGGTVAAGSYAAPGWRDYFLNKGSDALGSAGGYASRLWGWSKGVPGAGVVPRAIGNIGSMGYDNIPTWEGLKATPGAIWQGLKAAPSVGWEGLKSAPGTVAEYATSPYIAQGIAQRLPSASFVKDYPTTTNVAALAAAGYTLYKGGQYATNWYQGPLDSQILDLVRQENNADISTLTTIHNKLDPLLAQKSEQLLSSSPGKNIFEKIQWLLNFMSNNQYSYPSTFANQRLLYYIYNMSIGLLKQKEQDLIAYVKNPNLPIAEQNQSEMLTPVYEEINEVTQLLSTLTQMRNKLPKPEQAPGYFGWIRRKIGY